MDRSPVAGGRAFARLPALFANPRRASLPRPTTGAAVVWYRDGRIVDDSNHKDAAGSRRLGLCPGGPQCNENRWPPQLERRWSPWMDGTTRCRRCSVHLAVDRGCGTADADRPMQDPCDWIFGRRHDVLPSGLSGRQPHCLHCASQCICICHASCRRSSHLNPPYPWTTRPNRPLGWPQFADPKEPRLPFGASDDCCLDEPQPSRRFSNSSPCPGLFRVSVEKHIFRNGDHPDRTRVWQASLAR